MQITEKAWVEYITKMSQISQKAADLMQSWVQKNGLENDKALLDYAYALSQHYGQAIGALSCQMYEATAAAQGVIVPTAEVADLPDYGEVAKAVKGTKKQSPNNIPGTLARLVKQVGADTTLKNAERDGAQFAWVPHGDTCAFCITLASRGWQNMSKKALRNGHAEHIHAHCDCEYAVRFDGKSGAARSASDHRLFRQRPRQEPPERLKAGFVPLAGASRSIRSAYCLPPGMIVQHRTLPLIRRKKLRLCLQKHINFLRAARSAALQFAAGRKRSGRFALLRQKRMMHQ